jgi:mannose-6-phosphate isomerase
MLYPLTFEPIYQSKIWGGDKLSRILEKPQAPQFQCGESWEVSTVPGSISQVAQGPLKGRLLSDLLDQYGEALVGAAVKRKFGDTFPLLIKYIDASELLSVQVHPDDALAAHMHGSLGKTEMWYIVHAEPGAWLYAGWSRPVSREAYIEAFEQGNLLSLLQKTEVQPGDVFYIPAGLIHSIGAGIVLAEIQENSDVTYRVYDFDRNDSAGNTRELHLKEALNALAFGEPTSPLIRRKYPLHGVEEVVSCPHFTTRVVTATQPMERDYAQVDSLVVVMVMAGAATLNCQGISYPIRQGETILMPAALPNWRVEPISTVRLLETYISA